MGFNIKGILNPFLALQQAGRKPHTIRFPYEEKQVAERYRGLHYNDLEKCIGCGTCSTICQNKAIDMIEVEEGDVENSKRGDSGLRPRVDNGRCCWCALCVEVCPTGSLSLTSYYNYVSDDADSFLWTPGVDNPEGHKELSFVSDNKHTLLDFNRIPMRELEGKERVKSFAEVVLGYIDEEAQKEAARCISCSICTEVCPVHMHIPEYINAIYKGNTDDAVRIIYDNNPLGETCGKVCTRQCEDVCPVGSRGEPIAIRWLKRYATEKVDFVKDVVNPEIKPANGKKVGIIGAGPSGLTAGYYLALRGFDVTIYEAKAKAGGMIMYGIPKYRLPMDSLDKQIKYMEEIGVKIRYNTKVGENISFSEIEKENDAVFIGIGYEVPYTIGINGEDLENSIQSINFLRDVNSEKPVDIGKRVAVIGGGNVAIDAARVSRRFDAEVTILYRRREEDMPADWEEIEGAKEEGVIFKTQAIPLEVIDDGNGKVKAIRYGNAEMVSDEKGGRPRPVLIEGDEVVLELDTVIGAIGQEADYSFLPEEAKEKITFERGRIVTNDMQQTSLPHVFAGGDIVNRTADAISAIADGFRAVKGIEQYILSK